MSFLHRHVIASFQVRCHPSCGCPCSFKFVFTLFERKIILLVKSGGKRRKASDLAEMFVAEWVGMYN